MRSIDVGAPIGTVYDQWTQFEEYGSFMHRVQGVEQKEPEAVVWHENIWGRKRDWNIEIVEQVPRERIEWKIKGGGEGLGVITFHELAPRLTRLEIVFDWQPHGMVEKLASGLRFHKRAARSDLCRFKAFVETRGEATGGWRGTIEDGHAKRETRNRRNSEADPIPTEARQHEPDENEGSDGSDGGRRAHTRRSGPSGRAATPRRVTLHARSVPAIARSAPGQQREDGHEQRSRSYARNGVQLPSARAEPVRARRRPRADPRQGARRRRLCPRVGDRDRGADIDARIVIASVDTYLRFAEAVNRLDLSQTETAGIDELRKGGGKEKAEGALEGAKEEGKSALSKAKEKVTPGR